MIDTQSKLIETRDALQRAADSQAKAQNDLTYWTQQVLLLQGRLSAWQEFHPVSPNGTADVSADAPADAKLSLTPEIVN